LEKLEARLNIAVMSVTADTSERDRSPGKLDAQLNMASMLVTAEVSQWETLLEKLKHGLHGRDARCVPLGNILVKGICPSKHGRQICGTTHIPLANVLIEASRYTSSTLAGTTKEKLAKVLNVRHTPRSNRPSVDLGHYRAHTAVGEVLINNKVELLSRLEALETPRVGVSGG
jgi:hypothetical protein